MNKKLLVSTAIWGDYVDHFLNYTLQTLFSKGNFSVQHKNISVFFFFQIEKKNIIKFKKNKFLKNLNVEFGYIDKKLENKKQNKYSTLNLAQNIVLNKVNQENYEYLMLFYPDSIFPENYVKKCLKLIKDKKNVLSPGPLVNLEKFKNYKLKTKRPYHLKNLVNFTKNNLHPYYDSLINSNRANTVNIFDLNKNIILNCYDLHISIMHKDLCVSNIDFDTIDGNYLTKINLNLDEIAYANDPNDLFIISYESFFSKRPAFHYDKLKYERLNLNKIYRNDYLNKTSLKKNNLINGYYVLNLNKKDYEETINRHLSNFKNSILRREEKKNSYNVSLQKVKLILNTFFIFNLINSLIKRTLRFLIKIYLKSPILIKNKIKSNIQKNSILLKLKILIFAYVYS